MWVVCHFFTETHLSLSYGEAYEIVITIVKYFSPVICTFKQIVIK